MARFGKTVKIANGVEATEGAYYIQPYRKYTLMHADRLVAALDCLRNLLDLPADLRVVIKPIAKKTTRGCYWHHNNTIWVDPRTENVRALVETLAHECVHAEQYKQGRLAQVWDNRKGYIYQWCGQINFNKGTTYAKYREQPWEVEAFDRQEALAKTVFNMMGEF